MGDDNAYVSNKKALLIGCNYIGTKDELHGCINDVKFIKKKLEGSYGFSKSNIIIMTDKSKKPFYPTKTNILKTFINFLSSSTAGDLLFLLFSGHGSTTIDKNTDETNGLDEMIIPVDFNGIKDDDLKKCIDKYLHKDATLFAVFDSCFSGSVLDLKYQYTCTINNNKNIANAKNIDTLGNVIMISGCKDSQTSEDAYIKLPRGAFTWAFLNSLKDPNIITWKDLLSKIRGMLKGSDFKQIPQLSSGKPIDVNSKICFL